MCRHFQSMKWQNVVFDMIIHRFSGIVDRNSSWNIAFRVDPQFIWMANGVLFLRCYLRDLVCYIRKLKIESKSFIIDQHIQISNQILIALYSCSFVQTILCYSDPGSHPFISKEEREFLQVEIGQLKRNDDLPPTPWFKILTSVPMIALVFAQVRIVHSWLTIANKNIHTKKILILFRNNAWHQWWNKKKI